MSILYSKVPLTRPPMVLVEAAFNSEQASLMRPFYIEECILVLKQAQLQDMLLRYIAYIKSIQYTCIGYIITYIEFVSSACGNKWS